MKKSLLLLLFTFFIYNLQAQGPNIGQTSTATVVEGRININIDVFTIMTTGYLGHTYTVEENLLKVIACYHETILAILSEYTIEIFISIANPEIYNVQVHHYDSSILEECDYDTLFASNLIPLSITDFDKNSQNVFFRIPFLKWPFKT